MFQLPIKSKIKNKVDFTKSDFVWGVGPHTGSPYPLNDAIYI
jgi:hypothetical protein